MLRKMLIGLFVVALVVGGIVVPPAYAGQATDDVGRALTALEKAAKEDGALSPALRGALENLSRAMREERREPAKRPLASEEVREAVSSVIKEQFKGLSFSGDFRFRQETDANRVDKEDRNRQRIRGRLGLGWDINDEWKVATRLRTGSREDPNSPHETLGTAFKSFEANFDQWFATYRPKWGGGSWLAGGKFVHPLRSNPVYSELVWDADINPTGGYFGYRRENITKNFRDFQLVAGGYSIDENDVKDEVSAFVTQGAGTFSLAKDLSASTALGFYRYANLGRSTGSELGNDGNATVGTKFRSRFEILNPMLHFTYTGLPYPVVFGGEFIHNVSARKGDHDNGFGLGAALGSSRKKGDWRAAYQWSVVEQEAVFSPFAQDDHLTTNHRSHYVSLQYRLFDRVEIRPWLIVSQRDKGNDQNQYKFRVDLNINF